MKTILMLTTKPIKNDPRVFNEAKSLSKKYKVVVIRLDDIHKEKSNCNIFETGNKYDVTEIIIFCDSKKYKIKGLKMFLGYYKSFITVLNFIDISNITINAIHSHDLSTLYLGALLKKRLHIPLLYDSHEIWSFMITRKLPIVLNKVVEYSMRLYERMLLKKVDIVITVNNALKYFFVPITNKPVEVIMNCKHFNNIEYTYPEYKKFTMIYLGLLAEHRFVLNLIHVAKLLEPENVNLILAGKNKPIVPQIKKEIYGYSNIVFLGEIPMQQVLDITKKSHVVISMINPNDKNDSFAYTNKQFEAMSLGRPVITTKNTLAGNLTKRCNCGLVIDYNEQSLIESILLLKGNPEYCKILGINGLEWVYKKYNWQKQEDKLLEIYKEVLSWK